jgi:hypothetical protein
MQKIYNTVQELVSALPDNKDLENAIRNNPTEALNNVAALAYTQDKWVYRIVVGALGSAALLTIIGYIVLAFVGKSMPEGVVALGSASVGALAGLLAPSPAK